MINKTSMKAKLNGILKYAKKLKRFQEGGVTFFEAPTMYNPEEDFYMKSAYSRYNASQKSKKEKKTKDPKAIEGKYLTDGPKGTRDFYNNVISNAVGEYRRQLMAGGEGWGTSAEGMAAADRTKRIVAEATAANSNIKKDRENFLSDLSDNDRTSIAYVKGNYLVKNKETNEVDTITAEDYMANPEKYQKFTVDEAIRYADNHPQQSSKIYEELGSVAAGNTFIKENITKEKAVANGVPLNSNDLYDIYENLSTNGGFTEKGINAGVDQILSNQLNSIIENTAARDNIMRRVYEDPAYVANIIKAPKDKRGEVKANAMKAEVFKLIYMHGTAKGKGTGSSNGNDPTGGKNYKLTDRTYMEAIGYKLKETKNLTSTDFASHMQEGSKEFLTIFNGTRVNTTKGEIQKINQVALNDPKGDKSSNLASVQAFSDLTAIDFDKIYGIDGLPVSGENGIFKDSQTAKNNMVFTGGDMSRVSMPSWPDGSPMTGMGVFLEEFRKEMEGVEPKGSDLDLNDEAAQWKTAQNNALLKVKNNGSPEAKLIAEYLLLNKDGEVETSNKLAAETYMYVDGSKIEDYPGAKKVEDEEEEERYFKQNPSVEKDFAFNYNKRVLVKVPVYIDFLPPTDIVSMMDSSINEGTRNAMIQQSARTMTVNQLLNQVAPIPQ